MWNLYFPLSIIYLEIVFILSTGIPLSPWNIFVMSCSAIAYGSVCLLLGSLFKHRYVNRGIKALLLFIQGIAFCIVYFVFLEFRVFYSIATMTNAAGNAIGQFSYNIKILLLCPNGIIHIILYELPFFLYLIIMRKDKAGRAGKKSMALCIMSAVLFFSLYMQCVYSDDMMAHVYTDEYGFDQAVRTFGVDNAIRLDIETLLFGPKTYKGENSTGGFVLADVPAATTVTAPSWVTEYAAGQMAAASENSVSDNEPVEIVYTPNVLDIDFEELATTVSGDLQSLDLYCASLTPSMKNPFTGLFKGKNLIIITAEAFSAEAIREDITPTLYRMATKGIQFTDFYQPASAGTTGGEYGVIMGMLPTSGGSSMINTSKKLNYMTMGYQLNMLGYYGMAYHNNDYTYYSRNTTHINLGYSNGYMGYGNGLEEFITPTWPESDLEMIEGTLPTYIDQQPFNIYYMSVSGHSLYSYGSNAMSRKNWEKVENLECSDLIKAYLASQVELDSAMEYLIAELEEAGIADDTVIVICADHFPYGLDSQSTTGGMPGLTELYGYSISNNLVRDHNRLIIWSGCLEDMEPIVVDTPTFSPDITPTLLNLFGVDFDSRLLAGRDVFSDAQPLMFDLSYNWKTDLGTYVSGSFTPVSEDVEIPEGYVDSIKTIVRNKINFMKMCASTDFYRHVFPDAESSMSPVTYGVTTYTWNVNAGGGEETADPGAATDPNAAAVPDAVTDPNAATDPGTVADQGAVPVTDPGTAAPTDTTVTDPATAVAPEG